MSFVTHLKGLGSNHHYPADQLMNLDPIDGRPVTMELDLDAFARTYPNNSWYQPDLKNMWRFGGLLPLDNLNEADRKSIVCRGEGHTPLLPASHLSVAKKANVQLWIKDEGHPHAGFGENPTHSFKDRGMAVVASMAKHFQLDALAVPTQGNAGDSLCYYARQAGMRVAVAMPSQTPLPILGAVAAAEKIDSRVSMELVEGTIREAGECLKEKYLPQGYFSCATFQEPGWRIEGKKTMGLEIAEALADYKGWKLPDAIIYPTGGGTGVLGMWKAFDELETLGLIDSHRPRIYAVQSEATTPVVKAIEQEEADTTAQSGGETIAYGLNVPGGVGHFKVLDIIRQSGGSAMAIAEDAMADMLTQLWQETGWWMCPEGAAAVAAIEPLMDSGELSANEAVVVINTGSFEKYLPDVRSLLRS